MDIQEAAKRLRLSQRHIRRLIESGALPAKRIKKLVEVEVWDIDSDILEAAFNALGDWRKHENFFEWMMVKMKQLDITFPELSKKTKLPILEIVDDDTMIEKLNSRESEVKDKIIAALIRATMERRLHSG